MGLFFDTPQESLLKLKVQQEQDRLNQLQQSQQSLLGNTVTTTGTLASNEFDPQGNIINPQATVQQPRVEKTGFLGSDRGTAAQAQLLLGLQSAGTDPKTVETIRKVITPEKPTPLLKNLKAAGVNLDTPEGQTTLLDILKRPDTNINLNQNVPDAKLWTPAEKKAAGFREDSIVATDPKTGLPKQISKGKFTQDEQKAGGFALRMNDATTTLNKIFAEDPGFDPSGTRQGVTGLGSSVFGGEGLISDTLSAVGNQLRSDTGQKYEQATANWLSANLRKESGAVLGKKEIADERKKWFPVFGDSDAVIKQKAEARKKAEAAMQKTSGGSFGELKRELVPPTLEEIDAELNKRVQAQQPASGGLLQ